jgi:hypothetical protein
LLVETTDKVHDLMYGNTKFARITHIVDDSGACYPVPEDCYLLNHDLMQDVVRTVVEAMEDAADDAYVYSIRQAALR